VSISIDQCDEVHRDGPWDCGLCYAKAAVCAGLLRCDIARSHEWYNWKSIFALGFNPCILHPPRPLVPSRPSSAPQVRSSPAIYDACSKSFGLYANDYSCIGKAVYRLALIAIELAEDSFSCCSLRSRSFYVRDPSRWLANTMYHGRQTH